MTKQRITPVWDKFRTDFEKHGYTVEIEMETDVLLKVARVWDKSNIVIEIYPIRDYERYRYRDVTPRECTPSVLGVAIVSAYRWLDDQRKKTPTLSDKQLTTFSSEWKALFRDLVHRGYLVFWTSGALWFYRRVPVRHGVSSSMNISAKLVKGVWNLDLWDSGLIPNGTRAHEIPDDEATIRFIADWSESVDRYIGRINQKIHQGTVIK